MKRVFMVLLLLMIAAPVVAQAKVSGSVVVTATVTDAGCGVKQVQFFLGTTPLGPVLTTAPYSYTWDTRPTPDSMVDIRAVAQDKSGGPTPLPGKECDGSVPNSATATKQVEIDNVPADTTAPTVTITSPIAGNVSGKVDVQVATADTSGVQTIQLFIGGQLKSTTQNTETLTYNWNTNPYKGDIVELKAVAFDAIGNGPGTGIVKVQVNR